MATMGPTPIAYAFKANSDLSAKQFFFVKLTANDTVDLCSAATDIPIGVLQNNPTSGNTAEVVLSGITKVTASATIAAGATIGTASTGKAAALVAGTDTTKYVVGQVLFASNGDGSQLTAAINCVDPHRAA